MPSSPPPPRPRKQRTESGRDALERFMQDTADAPGAQSTAMLPLDPGGFGTLPRDARQELGRRVASTLAGVYLNLGIMQAQAERFARAAEFFEETAAIDAAFPQRAVLARRRLFQRATVRQSGRRADACALDRPGNADARRMLALASLNIDDFAKAAELLRDDPQRDTDPSLQFAYGVALVRERSGGRSRNHLLPTRRRPCRQRGVERRARPGARRAGRLRRRHCVAAACAGAEARRGGGERHARHHLFEAGTAA